MAIQSSLYILDGTTRTYPSSKHIATKQHCAVYGKIISSNTWEIIDFESYNVVNNSIIFTTAPSNSIYSSIEIRVSDSQDELSGTLDSISLVASSIINVNTVASNIGSVNLSGKNISNINTVAQNISSVLSVASNAGNINAVASINSNVSLVASAYYPIIAVAAVSNDLSAIAASVVPNISEILLADTNATTASNAAISATSSSISAFDSKALAEKWSSEAENIQVVAGKYSAYHWSQKAKANASESFSKTVSATAIDIGLINSDGSLFVSIPKADYSTNKSGVMSSSQAKKLEYSSYFDATRDANAYYLKQWDATTGLYEIRMQLNPANQLSAGIITADQYNTFDGKQNALVSGTNIKTINGSSVLGSGNLAISVATDVVPTDASTNPVQSNGVFDALATKASTSHNHTVDELSNVVITANSDNELLAWDSATSKWINQTAVEAGLATSSHNHTGVYEPADATILKSASIGVTIQEYNASTTTQGNIFNGANQLVKTDALGKLPAIDGSQLTNLPSGASTLDGLSDVVITTPASGQVIKYNGSSWVNDTDVTGGGGSINYGLLNNSINQLGGSF